MTMAFFPVRTVNGKELEVALIIESRARSLDLDIRSIVVPPRIKGFVIVEAPAPFIIMDAIKGIKHVKGGPGKKMTKEEVIKLVKPKPIIELLEIGDIVELVAGPFKGMKAKVEAKDTDKNEVVLNILEAAYPLQITVPASYVKPVRR